MSADVACRAAAAILTVLWGAGHFGCEDAAVPDVVDASAAEVASAMPSAAQLAPSARDEPKPSCRATEACRYEGRCDGAVGACTANADDDCRKSTGCIDWGQCSLRDGLCQPANNDDCRESWDCKHRGRCSYRKTTCVVARDSDCKRSSLCKFERKCQAHKGRCRK